MNDNKRQGKVPLTLEIDKKLKDRLTRIAVAEERSISQIVRLMIRQGVEKRESA